MLNPGATEWMQAGADNLIYHGTDLISESYPIAQGTKFERGAVLGRVTATGEVKLSVVGAGDGSEVPFGIAGNSQEGTERATVYTRGSFNSRAISLGSGHSVESIRDGLRDLGIYLLEAEPSYVEPAESGS